MPSEPSQTSTLQIRLGDVWHGAIGEANITGYDPRLDQFELRTGARISRAILIQRYHRQYRGTGRVLFEGPAPKKIIFQSEGL